MLVQKMSEKEIVWKVSFTSLSIYLCFFLFLTSCETSKNSGIPDFEDDTSKHSPVPISDRLVARIYFDATLSMQGYVVPGSTRYTQMCRYLESVIVSGWENATINFYRFGEEVEAIDRSTYLNLSRPGFYENNKIFRETFIQKIIDHEAQLTPDEVEESITTEESTETATIREETNNIGEKSPLVVIVTDLFQDNGDLTVLVTQLKEQYIKKGYEVGLLGLRSEFDGTVYDLGGVPLRYQNTLENPETYRPFYLLVLGKHADIARYFDRLIATGISDATDDVNTVIFSRHLVNPLLSFENATIDNLENLNRVSIANNPDSRVKEYRITDKKKRSQISAKLKLELLSYVMPFDSDELDDLISAKHPPNDIPDISQKAKNCLTVTSTLLKNNDSNELSVEFTLDSQSLLRKRIYLYEVTLGPDIDSFKEPDWCSEWDMGNERNGAKTLNLVNFVHGLSQATALIHEPIIAKFHFYIEKR